MVYIKNEVIVVLIVAIFICWEIQLINLIHDMKVEISKQNSDIEELQFKLKRSDDDMQTMQNTIYKYSIETSTIRIKYEEVQKQTTQLQETVQNLKQPIGQIGNLAVSVKEIERKLQKVTEEHSRDNIPALKLSINNFQEEFKRNTNDIFKKLGAIPSDIKDIEKQLQRLKEEHTRDIHKLEMLMLNLKSQNDKIQDAWKGAHKTISDIERQMNQVHRSRNDGPLTRMLKDLIGAFTYIGSGIYNYFTGYNHQIDYDRD